MMTFTGVNIDKKISCFVTKLDIFFTPILYLLKLDKNNSS